VCVYGGDGGGGVYGCVWWAGLCVRGVCVYGDMCVGSFISFRQNIPGNFGEM
jgi:hypothetical protein